MNTHSEKTKMKVKELIKMLEKQDQELEVVIKNYDGSSDIWSPKTITYVERMNQANKILIN